MQQTKIICSFDVGILNLAYCILDTDYKIKKWEIINVINRDKIVCGATIKGTKNKPDKICGKAASLFGHSDVDNPTTDNIKYYCGTHKKHYEPLTKDWDTTYMTAYTNPDPKEKSTCCHTYPQKQTTCTKNATYTLNNQGSYYCNAHKSSVIKARHKAAQLQKIKKKGANKTNVRILSENIFNKLDKNPDMLKTDTILIENQPSLINPTMKTVSAFLYSYFVLRGVVDKNNKEDKPITDIEFKSPSNKIKTEDTYTDLILKDLKEDDSLYKLVVILLQTNLINSKLNPSKELVHLVLKYLMNKKPTLQDIVDNKYNKILKDISQTKTLFSAILVKIEKDKKNYAITKQLGIKYTEAILKATKQDNWLDHLNTYKKKDDLCDAFLQAYYYLN